MSWGGVTAFLLVFLLGAAGALHETHAANLQGRGAWLASTVPDARKLVLRGGGDARMWVVDHGVEGDAATLAWEKVDSAQCYELQLKVGDGADDDFKTVSDKLTSTMVCFFKIITGPNSFASNPRAIVQRAGVY